MNNFPDPAPVAPGDVHSFQIPPSSLSASRQGNRICPTTQYIDIANLQSIATSSNCVPVDPGLLLLSESQEGNINLHAYSSLATGI